MKKKSKREINKILKTKKNEDPETIKALEKFLLEKRGYVFKKPKSGESVILLLSGGLDSIMVWAYLLKELKLKVIPIYLAGGLKKIPTLSPNLRSINYFSKIFKKKFPGKYLPPKIIPASNTRNYILEKFLKPEKMIKKVLFEKIDQFGNVMIDNLGLMSSLSLYAALYAELFYAEDGIETKTIFCGAMPKDGESVLSQTFTSIRSAMTNLCINTNDYQWQFSSLPMEKELGLFNKKIDFIKWFHKSGFDPNKTWSCNTKSYIFHCGKCYSCYSRKENLLKARVKDTTKYMNHG